MKGWRERGKEGGGQGEGGSKGEFRRHQDRSKRGRPDVVDFDCVACHFHWHRPKHHLPQQLTV